VDQLSESAGVSLGPIALSLGDSARGGEGVDDDDDDDVSDYVAAHAAGKSAATAAWRQANLTEDGAVDLWLEDGFNAASRMAGGVKLDSGLLNVENKAAFGADWDPDCPVFTVKVTDPVTGKVLDIQVRESPV
jgi:ferredoxin